VRGVSSLIAITCPTCGVSTRASTGWVRSCGGVFCHGCTELILLDGERVASTCDAIDAALRELDKCDRGAAETAHAVNARRCIAQEFRRIA